MGLKSTNNFKTSPILHLCFIFLFLIGLTFMIFVDVVAFIIIRPFRRTLYSRIAGSASNIMVVYYEFIIFWCGARINIYGSNEDIKAFRTKSKLIISNHYGESDFIYLMVLLRTLGILKGFKIIIKRCTFLVPFVGWHLWFSEWISVKRSFIHDKENLEAKIKEGLSLPYPVSILLYPEGTRFTTKKREASVKFAENNRLTPLKYHLTPRIKGFITILPVIREMKAEIFDITVAFDNRSNPRIKDLLKGTACSLHISLKRIPLEDIPVEEEEVAKWLHNIFMEKDRQIEDFLQKGSFGPKKHHFRSGPSFLIWVFVTVLAALYILYSILTYVIINQAWFLFSGMILMFLISYGFMVIADKAMTVKDS